MGHTRKKKTNNIDTLRIVVVMFNSGFRSLSKLEFKCSVTQQRVTVVLDFMSLGVLVWHILGSTTVIMLITLYAYSGWYSLIP